MIRRIALANMKYNKSKNILTGIAIFLTTILLFVVPSVGYDMLLGEKEGIKELYPNWHALFRNIDEEAVQKLAAHHLVKRCGLRSDVGYMADDDADIGLIYMDEEGLDLYKIELLEGRLPEAENEIVVTRGILKELSQTGEIGDRITVPYQVDRNGGLDYIEEKEFVISGFLADTEFGLKEKAFTSIVSKEFLKASVPEEQIKYRFLFQVQTEQFATTEEIEADINVLAKQFEVPEQSIKVNEDFLWANYIDPAYVPGIIGIMLIIVTAGVITIYSIYYVSMGERVQEFGKIKAIGATKGQLRRIVFLEGFAVAAIAVPLGLLAGSILVRYVFWGMFELYKNENGMITVLRKLIMEGKLQLLHWWIYLLTILVAVLTVYLSLLRPMQVASRVSEIEAMRYQDGQTGKKGKKTRKGYTDITVGRMAKVYLAGNKKKSVITICSMAVTGLFFMVVATILSCADPEETSRSTFRAQYEISPEIKFGDKEHPELEWSQVQKNNPLTEELKNKILQIDGIQSVEVFEETYVTGELFNGEKEWIVGIPETGKKELEEGIIKGNVTYEELSSGDKVVADEDLFRWYPHLKLGDILEVAVEDGEGTHIRQLEIAAIGDYPNSFNGYSFLIMSQKGIHQFSDHNLNFYYHIYGEEPYDAQVEEQLNSIVSENGHVNMKVWKDVFEEKKSNIAMTSGICYVFLGVLGVICIMNMINTMINSVHIRKKELGMLQAVGMSDAQLQKMLRIEGMFYTVGTLLAAIGGGSLAGYPVFLWAKSNGILSIRDYHYPVIPAIAVILVLTFVQMVLTLVLGRSVKRQSLIERIRFSN